MYTRPYPQDQTPPPTGYGGCMYQEESCSPLPDPVCPAPCEDAPTAKEKQKEGLLSKWLPDGLRGFLTGDLLLPAIALLLIASGDEGDCETQDNDLWLLLLLLYIMK